MMKNLKLTFLIPLWVVMGLIPIMFMPVAWIMFKSGAVMSLWINQWMDYCIRKLEKYENAE